MNAWNMTRALVEGEGKVLHSSRSGEANRILAGSSQILEWQFYTSCIAFQRLHFIPKLGEREVMDD